MEQRSLWKRMNNQCLKNALKLLKEETTPMAATVEAMCGLVDIAIKIDYLDFLWHQQTRFGAAVFRAVPADRGRTDELFAIKNELQDIHTILKLIQTGIKAMNETAVNQLADSLEKAVHDMPLGSQSVV